MWMFLEATGRDSKHVPIGGILVSERLMLSDLQRIGTDKKRLL